MAITKVLFEFSVISIKPIKLEEKGCYGSVKNMSIIKVRENIVHKKNKIGIK